MPIISIDDARPDLSPYLGDLRDIVEGAWSDWMKGGMAPQMQHKRFRANYVWNQLIVGSKRKFDGNLDVIVETMQNWDGLLIANKLFLRFKKGTHKLLSRNYPTQAALAFNDQSRDLFGGIARLELIYVLNDSETAIDRIAVIQRHKKSVAWVLDLINMDQSEQKVIAFTPPETDVKQSAADRVIKRKKGRKADETRKSEDAG